MQNNQIQINKAKLSDIKVAYIEKYLVGKKILDVGAGYCYYSDWLITTRPHLEILSVDQLELEGNGFDFMHANLEDPLALDAEQFSTILAFDIIEHIDHEQQFVQELYRVCSPGGIIIGSVPHDDDKFLPAYNLTFNHRRDVTHKRYYIPEVLHETLSSAGFSNVVINKEGGISPQVIAEFFPQALRLVMKKFVGGMRRVGLISTRELASDLFFTAYKSS